MIRALLALGAIGVAVALVFLLAGDRLHREQPVGPKVATMPPIPDETPVPAEADQQGFLYGRVTTIDDTTYEGRLRFGGDEESFWGDEFRAPKDGNPWATFAPPEQLTEPRSIGIFGAELSLGEQRIKLDRPLLARFGDIERIVAQGTSISVTLKSGTVFDLDRMGSDDLGDGLRVWDTNHGVVDLIEQRIRIIDLLPTAQHGDTPGRLHGMVRTQDGKEFRGFIQWDWRKGVDTDLLHGRSAEAEHALPFHTIRSIRHNGDSGAIVSLIDGTQLALSGTRDVGQGNRGIIVADERRGRVRVLWDRFAFARFSPGEPSPAYVDFPAGEPLHGGITTRDGRQLRGRLVYDLDESETTEMLDASARGVHYTIPFGLIKQIRRPIAGESNQVVFHGGDTLMLESTGDLGPDHAGMLVFADGADSPPEYVRWSAVATIILDRPRAMYPPIGGR